MTNETIVTIATILILSFKPFHNNPKFTKFVLQFHEHGRLAEWLGAGLQNRLERFDSATDLNTTQTSHLTGGLFFGGADIGANGASSESKELHS